MALLRGWERGLCDEMKLAVLSAIEKDILPKILFEPFNEERSKLASARCQEELQKFGLDPGRIAVICDKRNNTPERLGRNEFWIEFIVGFGLGAPDKHVIISYVVGDSGKISMHETIRN